MRFPKHTDMEWTNGNPYPFLPFHSPAYPDHKNIGDNTAQPELKV